jgi:hypothetical protein
VGVPAVALVGTHVRREPIAELGRSRHSCSVSTTTPRVELAPRSSKQPSALPPSGAHPLEWPRMSTSLHSNPMASVSFAHLHAAFTK